jgi:hypothetical protein
MSSSSGGNKAIGCITFVVLFLVIGLIQSLVQFIRNKPLYTEGHTAFLSGDCSTAIQPFDVIVSRFSVFDFGKLKTNSRSEKGYCEDFNTAASNGLTALYQYMQNSPGNPLNQYADQRADAMLAEFEDKGNASNALAGDACTMQAEFTDAGLLSAEDTLPRFLFDCSKKYLDEGSIDLAFEKISLLLDEHPNHSLSSQVWDSLENSTDFCPMLQQMSESATFTNNANQFADILLACGNNSAANADYDSAVNAYQIFLAQYPNHPRVEEVNQLLPDLLINQARASGAGTIERPESSGWAPEGVARVVIQNDSPHDLRIVFSGPDARIETLDACAECTDYSTIGPIFCPEKGPIGTYDLTPGQFEVLVETTNESDVTPFTGSWDLQGGNEFYSCFFIVTTYY